MRDILIEFLQKQLNQQQKSAQDLAVFLAELLGVPPDQIMSNTDLSPLVSAPIATHTNLETRQVHVFGRHVAFIL